VISTALIPYRTDEGRFTVSGPPLVVKSRQALALSLAIHELATNALKYGALTVAAARCRLRGHPTIRRVSQHLLSSGGSGGPPASEPARVGFGSRLISRVLKDDFGGSVEVSYGSTGLICRLTAPLENLATSPE
jgi:Signal transduction histidine kinase